MSRIVLKDRTIENDKIYLGTNEKLTDNIRVSMISTPIVTYTGENAFTLDTGAVETYSVPFVRTNDTDDGNKKPVDPTKPEGEQRTWNNKEWIEEMRKRINQWQAKHDGYYMEYINPNSSFAKVQQNVYIGSFSTTYNCGVPESISGNISLSSGSMRCKNLKDRTSIGYGKSIPFQQMFIQMTSASGSEVYTIYGNTPSGEQYTCITSYEYVCGPTEPFPHITMTISKKRLANLAPSLVDDIRAGYNMLTLNACGHDSFLVTKCTTNNTTYRITAYSLVEAYKGLLVGSVISMETSPEKIIRRLLYNRYFIVDGNSISFKPDKIHFHYDKTEALKRNDWEDPSGYFSSGCSVWYVLSVCAMKLNCSIWFSGSDVFIVDLTMNPNTITEQEMPAELHKYFNSVVYLNAAPFSPDEGTAEYEFCQRVQNVPKLGNEGDDTTCNIMTITINADDAKKGYLAQWDCTTGKPMKDLSANPYDYKTGDFFVVAKVNSSGNLCPTGTQYDKDKTSSTVVQKVAVGDIFLFYNDGKGYRWIHSYGSTIYTETRKNGSYPSYISQRLQESQNKRIKINECNYAIPEISPLCAQRIVDIYPERFSDSQQSITFTVTELGEEKEEDKTTLKWRSYFPEITHIDSIVDHNSDTLITNESNYLVQSGEIFKRVPLYDKLTLSAVVRKFPEFSSEYTFGRIANTDLAQTTSIVQQAIGNR